MTYNEFTIALERFMQYHGHNKGKVTAKAKTGADIREYVRLYGQY